MKNRRKKYIVYPKDYVPFSARYYEFSSRHHARKKASSLGTGARIVVNLFERHEGGLSFWNFLEEWEVVS